MRHENDVSVRQFERIMMSVGCKRRRQNPSMERPGIPVAPE